LADTLSGKGLKLIASEEKIEKNSVLGIKKS